MSLHVANTYTVYNYIISVIKAIMLLLLLYNYCYVLRWYKFTVILYNYSLLDTENLLRVTELEEPVKKNRT